MQSARPSMIPAVLSRSSIHSALRHSAPPPRISMIPGRISIVPRPVSRPTMPPGARAARMMGTVRKVASQLARNLPRHIDVDDLVGAGSLGLADAFSRRGTMPGTEFEAFAAFRIRGAMLDELRRLDAMPRRSRRSAKRMAQAQRVVEQKQGRPARDEEIASELGLELEAYQALRAKIDSSRAPIPLSAIGHDDDDTVHEVADPKAEGPDALASRAQIGELLAGKVHALPERMRLVLVGIYVEGQTLKQIGKSLGVSESRVCQIHTESLAALRSTLVADGEIDDERPSGTRLRAGKAKASEPTCRTRAA